MSRQKAKGRIRTAIFFYLRFACRMSVAPMTVFFQSPAFLLSCTKVPTAAAPLSVHLRAYGPSEAPERVDLLYFREDGAQQLDACQQMELQGGSSAYGVSLNRDYHLVALTGRQDSASAYLDIRNYGDLCRQTFRLEEESPEAPRLFGETHVKAGRSRTADITLRPLLCHIWLRTLSCDFRERPYAGARFLNERIFLLHAGAEATPLGSPGGTTLSWLNPGFLDSLACARLPPPEMVLQDGLGPVGLGRIRAQREFYCYPNPATEDALGQSRTCLVLEGTVEGAHCYYPIPLPALKAGDSLKIDLTLLRMGTDSPDCPAEVSSYQLCANRFPWEQWSAQTILF